MSETSESRAMTCQRPPRLDLTSDKRNQSMTDQNVWSQKSSLSPNIQTPSPPILVPSVASSVTLPISFGDKYILVEQLEASNLYRCLDTQTHEELCCKVCLTFDVLIKVKLILKNFSMT